MRRVRYGAIVGAMLTLVLAVPAANAVSGPGANNNSKLAYAEEIAPSGDLTVVFSEGGQKRFDGVDYRLTATAIATWTCGEQSVSAQFFPTAEVHGVIPDDKGRVESSLVLDIEGSSGTICPETFSVAYSEIALVNLSTGHVYRLDDVSRTA